MSFRNPDSVVNISNISNIVPDKYDLKQNYPNPFNPETTIEFDLKISGFVTLKVYDIMGREVALLVNEKLPEGTFRKNFNSSNLPSGVYFYKINVSSENNSSLHFSETKRMILMK